MMTCFKARYADTGTHDGNIVKGQSRQSEIPSKARRRKVPSLCLSSPCLLKTEDCPLVPEKAMNLTTPMTGLTQQSIESAGMGDPIEPLDPTLTFAIIMSGPLVVGVMVWVAMKWFDS
jgi:hypothetical protein